jgi:hypothetical protein
MTRRERGAFLYLRQTTLHTYIEIGRVRCDLCRCLQQNVGKNRRVVRVLTTFGPTDLQAVFLVTLNFMMERSA